MKNKRLTAKDFDPKILELYDHYAHGKMTKRELLKNIGKYTAAGVTALSVFNNLMPNYTLAEQVNFNDPEIKAITSLTIVKMAMVRSMLITLSLQK